MGKIVNLFTVSLLTVGMMYINGPKAAQTEKSSSQFVRHLLKTVKKVKKADPDKNIFISPEEDQQNEKLASRLSQMLDIDHISKYALMQHWQGLGRERQTHFVNVFTSLLSKVAYPNASKFLKDLEVTVTKEKKVKQKAMVYTSVIHKEEGRIDIDFKLMRAADKWMVIDIYLDDVSLARNLRTQCLKIIRDHSFEELIARMMKKIRERDTAHLKEVTGRN